MSDSEIEELARKITEMLREQGERPPTDGLCPFGRAQDRHLSASEQEAVRDILKTKRKAVKAALFVFAALVLWILKDAYLWIMSHLAFK